VAVRRIVLGSPLPPTPTQGAALVISHDLINAYLTTVWASGSLALVPVSLPEAREHGFDLRHLAYRLPPVVTTAPGGRLRLEVPEVGVDLRTLGEPMRLFAAHLRLPLSVAMQGKEKLRFRVEKKAPPRVAIRCTSEGAGHLCPAQSRRFQQLVNIATELAFRPELAGPELAFEAALPAFQAPGVKIGVRSVEAIPRGIRVRLWIQ
jgi:hypothetical protein